MREEEKETNKTTPQKNQVSLSLLKSVLLWCSSFLVAALFCRGCLVVVVHVLRSSLSLSLVSFIAAEKNGTKKGDLDQIFLLCLGF